MTKTNFDRRFSDEVNPFPRRTYNGAKIFSSKLRFCSHSEVPAVIRLVLVNAATRLELGATPKIRLANLPPKDSRCCRQVRRRSRVLFSAQRNLRS